MFAKRKNQACDVCENPISGNFYRGNVCNGCRVFFFRLNAGSYEKSILLCEKDDQCLIYYKLLKGACSGCRYRRCLEAGMQKTVVGKRKNKHNYCVTYYTVFEKTTNISRLYGQSLNQGVNALIQTRDKTSLWTLLNYWKGYDDHVLARNGENPSQSGGNGNFTLSEILISPRSCIRRNTAALSTFCGYSTGVNLHFGFISRICRIMVMNAEWLAAFPEFHQMSAADRILLLRNSPHIYLSYYESTKTGRFSEFSKYVSNSLTPGIQNIRDYFLKGRKPVANMIAEIISKYQVTEVEMLLLRLITLFAPKPAMSDDGRALAIQTRFRLSQILAEYIKKVNYTATDAQKRLADLLSMEQYVKVFMGLIDTENLVFLHLTSG